MYKKERVSYLWIALEGLALSAEEKEILLHPGVGGVVLFSRNYNDKSQLKNLTSTIKHIDNRILIAVDHEGGRVQRFKEGFSTLSSLGQLGQNYLDALTILGEKDDFLVNYSFDNQENLADLKNNYKNIYEAVDQIINHAATLAYELKDVGCDFSFGPVLDCNYGTKDHVIGDRSFARSSKIVSQLGRIYINTLKAAGMASVGKHFPGHGGTATDSHHALAFDERSFDELYHSDLLPFSDLADDLNAIMPAHVIYPNIDKLPVTFSSYWLKTILREQMLSKSVVISDDLLMAGVSLYEPEIVNRVSYALEAGCDMVMICNSLNDIIKVLDSYPYNKLQDIDRLNRISSLLMR